MKTQKIRNVSELPQAEYRLVQLVEQRLGFVASASLTCFLFGEIPRLAGISLGEAELIEQYATMSNITLPQGASPSR